jgi:hypothetical protein
MYWDALMSAGKRPTYGHLVSNGRTAGVATLLDFLRGRTDASGKQYDLVVEDWAKHGITP